MAKKAKRNIPWFVWVIVVILLGAIGWKYFGNEIIGSKASTLGGGVVYVGIGAESGETKMVLGGTRNQQDSVWRLSFVPDAGDLATGALLKSLTLTIKSQASTSPISKASLRQVGGKAVLATAVPMSGGLAGNKLVFQLNQPLKLLANKWIRLEVLADYGDVDGSKLKNDSLFLTNIAQMSDVQVVGLDGVSPIGVRAEGPVSTANRYLFKSYLSMSMNSQTPGGQHERQPNDTIAKYDLGSVSAKADITFSKRANNYISIDLRASKPTGQATPIYLKDASTGTTIDESRADLSKTGHTVVTFQFPSEFSVPFSGKVVRLITDTTTLISGSGVDLSIKVSGDNAVGWGIDSVGNYHHGNLILHDGLQRYLNF